GFGEVIRQRRIGSRELRREIEAVAVKKIDRQQLVANRVADFGIAVMDSVDAGGQESEQQCDDKGMTRDPRGYAADALLRLNLDLGRGHRTRLYRRRGISWLREV